MRQTTLILRLVFVLGCVALIPTFAQTETWFDKISKIKLAKSSRSQVEDLMGSPAVDHVAKFERVKRVYYKSKIGMLEVAYSIGNCTTADGLDIPEDTVVDFFFRAFKPIKINRSKLELASFERKREVDTPNWVYINGKKGVRYAFYKDRLLSEVSFGLSAEGGTSPCVKPDDRLDYGFGRRCDLRAGRPRGL